MTDNDIKKMEDEQFDPIITDFDDDEPTKENTAPDAEEPKADLADDSTPAAVDEAKAEPGEKTVSSQEGVGSTEVLPPEGTTREFPGIQDNAETGHENPNPEESSKTELEPEFLKNPSASDENADAHEEAEKPEHITSSGNKVFEDKEALSNVGQIHQANTTAAYIEIVQPRIPGLEAALRAGATEAGLADGSIKPEDAPGFKTPEDGRNSHDGGNAEDGNSITGATKPTEDWKINPNSPIQVGDTKETAQAASNAKIENGDAVGETKSYVTGNAEPAKDGGAGELGENETTALSAASDEVPMDFVKQPSTESLPEKY